MFIKSSAILAIFLCRFLSGISGEIVLYEWNFSAPVRTVKVVAKLIGVELDIRPLDVLKGEQMQEWFIKLNPEHTVPTIVDNGISLGESHAISMYLIEKYAKDDKLYPKDLVKRARLQQRLFFDAGSLFVRLRDVIGSTFHTGVTDALYLTPMVSSLELLETTMVDSYLTGNEWNLADISLANSIRVMEVFYTIDANKLPKVHAWLERVSKNIPYFTETIGTNIEKFRELIQQIVQKKKV